MERVSHATRRPVRRRPASAHPSSQRTHASATSAHDARSRGGGRRHSRAGGHAGAHAPHQHSHGRGGQQHGAPVRRGHVSEGAHEWERRRPATTRARPTDTHGAQWQAHSPQPHVGGGVRGPGAAAVLGWSANTEHQKVATPYHAEEQRYFAHARRPSASDRRSPHTRVAALPGGQRSMYMGGSADMMYGHGDSGGAGARGHRDHQARVPWSPAVAQQHQSTTWSPGVLPEPASPLFVYHAASPGPAAERTPRRSRSRTHGSHGSLGVSPGPGPGPHLAASVPADLVPVVQRLYDFSSSDEEQAASQLLYPQPHDDGGAQPPPAPSRSPQRSPQAGVARRRRLSPARSPAKRPKARRRPASARGTRVSRRRGSVTPSPSPARRSSARRPASAVAGAANRRTPRRSFSPSKRPSSRRRSAGHPHQRRQRRSTTALRSPIQHPTNGRGRRFAKDQRSSELASGGHTARATGGRQRVSRLQRGQSALTITVPHEPHHEGVTRHDTPAGRTGASHPAAATTLPRPAQPHEALANASPDTMPPAEAQSSPSHEALGGPQQHSIASVPTESVVGSSVSDIPPSPEDEPRAESLPVRGGATPPQQRVHGAPGPSAGGVTDGDGSGDGVASSGSDASGYTTAYTSWSDDDAKAGSPEPDPTASVVDRRQHGDTQATTERGGSRRRASTGTQRLRRRKSTAATARRRRVCDDDVVQRWSRSAGKGAARQRRRRQRHHSGGGGRASRRVHVVVRGAEGGKYRAQRQAAHAAALAIAEAKASVHRTFAPSRHGVFPAHNSGDARYERANAAPHPMHHSEQPRGRGRAPESTARRGAPSDASALSSGLLPEHSAVAAPRTLDTVPPSPVQDPSVWEPVDVRHTHDPRIRQPVGPPEHRTRPVAADSTYRRADKPHEQRFAAMQAPVTRLTVVDAAGRRHVLRVVEEEGAGGSAPAPVTEGHSGGLRPAQESQRGSLARHDDGAWDRQGAKTTHNVAVGGGNEPAESRVAQLGAPEAAGATAGGVKMMREASQAMLGTAQERNDGETGVRSDGAAAGGAVSKGGTEREEGTGGGGGGGGFLSFFRVAWAAMVIQRAYVRYKVEQTYRVARRIANRRAFQAQAQRTAGVIAAKSPYTGGTRPRQHTVRLAKRRILQRRVLRAWNAHVQAVLEERRRVLAMMVLTRALTTFSLRRVLAKRIRMKSKVYVAVKVLARLVRRAKEARLRVHTRHAGATIVRYMRKLFALRRRQQYASLSHEASIAHELFTAVVAAAAARRLEAAAMIYRTVRVWWSHVGWKRMADARRQIYRRHVRSLQRVWMQTGAVVAKRRAMMRLYAHVHDYVQGVRRRRRAYATRMAAVHKELLAVHETVRAHHANVLALAMQRLWRGVKARRMISFLRVRSVAIARGKNRAAKRLQKAWRYYKLRCRVHRRRGRMRRLRRQGGTGHAYGRRGVRVGAATRKRLQRVSRAARGTQLRIRSAIVVQRAVRGMLVRRGLLAAAKRERDIWAATRRLDQLARAVQRQWHGFVYRRHEAARRIQNNWRAVLSRRRIRMLKVVLARAKAAAAAVEKAELVTLWRRRKMVRRGRMIMFCVTRLLVLLYRARWALHHQHEQQRALVRRQHVMAHRVQGVWRQRTKRLLRRDMARALLLKKFQRLQRKAAAMAEAQQGLGGNLGAKISGAVEKLRHMRPLQLGDRVKARYGGGLRAYPAVVRAMTTKAETEAALAVAKAKRAASTMPPPPGPPGSSSEAAAASGAPGAPGAPGDVAAAPGESAEPSGGRDATLFQEDAAEAAAEEERLASKLRPEVTYTLKYADGSVEHEARREWITFQFRPKFLTEEEALAVQVDDEDALVPIKSLLPAGVQFLLSKRRQKAAASKVNEIYQPDTAKAGEGVVDIRLIAGDLENSSFESQQWRRMRRGKRRYVKVPVDLRGNLRFAARDTMSVHLWYLPGLRDEAPLSEIKLVRTTHLYSPKHEALLTALRDVGFTRLFRVNLPAADLWPLPERVPEPAVEFALVGALATDAMPPLAGIAATTRSSLASATAAPPPSDVELFRRSFLPLPEDLGMYGVDGGTRVWVKYGTAFQRKDKHGDKLPEQLRRKPTLRILNVSEVEKRRQRMAKQQSKLQDRVKRVVESNTAIVYRDPSTLSEFYGDGGVPSYMVQGGDLVPTPRTPDVANTTPARVVSASRPRRRSSASGGSSAASFGSLRLPSTPHSPELTHASGEGESAGGSGGRRPAVAVGDGAAPQRTPRRLSPLPATQSLPAVRHGSRAGEHDESPRATMAPQASRAHSLYPARTLSLLDHRTLQQKQAQRPVVGGGVAELEALPPEVGLTVAQALAAKAPVGEPQRPRIGHQHDAAFVGERTQHDALVTRLLDREAQEIDLDLEAKRWAMATLRAGWSTSEEESSSSESSGSDSEQERRRRRRRRRRERRQQREAKAAADDGKAGEGSGEAAGGGETSGSDNTGSSGSESGSGSGSGDSSSEGDDSDGTSSTLSELTKAERQRLARSERLSKMAEVVRDRVEWSQRTLQLKISSAQLTKLQALWNSLCTQGAANGASLRDIATRLKLELDIEPLRKSLMALVDENPNVRMGYKLFVEFLVAYCMATPTEVLKVLFKAFRDADGGLRAMGLRDMIACLHPTKTREKQEQLVSVAANLLRINSGEDRVPFDTFAFLYRRLASLFFPMFQMQIDVQRLALGTAFWKRKLLVELERRKAAAKGR